MLLFNCVRFFLLGNAKFLVAIRWFIVICLKSGLDSNKLCCGSGSVLDPYSGASLIRIRIRNTDPDPHMQIKNKMEAKDARFKILINNSETQLIKNFFMWQYLLIVSKNIGTCFKENYFSLQLFWMFSFKIDSIPLDPDPNWAKILDPDPNSMYLDQQHWFLFAI